MDKYYEDVLKRTQQLSRDSLNRSFEVARKSKRIVSKFSKVGSITGIAIGLGLFLVGMIGFFVSHDVWFAFTMLVGIINMISNSIMLIISNK